MPTLDTIEAHAPLYIPPKGGCRWATLIIRRPRRRINGQYLSPPQILVVAGHTLGGYIFLYLTFIISDILDLFSNFQDKDITTISVTDKKKPVFCFRLVKGRGQQHNRECCPCITYGTIKQILHFALGSNPHFLAAMFANLAFGAEKIAFEKSSGVRLYFSSAAETVF